MKTYRPFAKESLAVSSTAVGFTAATYNQTTRRARRATITCETDQARIWVDGSTPTATVGHLLDPGDTLILENEQEIAQFLAIRATTDLTLRATFSD